MPQSQELLTLSKLPSTSVPTGRVAVRAAIEIVGGSNQPQRQEWHFRATAAGFVDVKGRSSEGASQVLLSLLKWETELPITPLIASVPDQKWPPLAGGASMIRAARPAKHGTVKSSRGAGLARFPQLKRLSHEDVDRALDALDDEG